MSVNKNQSAIREVRDQISLDFSDDKFLNIVTANLGITRPLIGFTDDVWRAIVKQIALEFKQILTQFHKLMAILFGPQITEVNTLAQAASIGDRSIFLNRDDNIPQVGTIILDEGLGSEETVDYCLINRRLHEVFLVTALVNDHLPYTRDAEQPLLFISGARIAVPSVRNFSITDFPYTVVVGRGTPAEEVASITAVSLDSNSLTLAAPLVNTHEFVSPTLLETTLLLDYVDSSVTLHLVDIKQFPSSGTLLLGPSDNDFTETVGGSIVLATVAASTFTADRQVGYKVVYEGNVTAALAGVEVDITINTDAAIVFATVLPAANAVGDRFKIRPRVDYSSVDYTTNDVVIRRAIADLTLVAGTEAELLVKGSTIAMAPVKSPGSGWDVIQSGPKKIDILIPEELQDNDLRSASYLHTNFIDPTPLTTLAANASLGDDRIDPVSLSGFPKVGVATIDPGGGTEENVGYFIPLSAVLVPIIGTLEINFIDGAAGNDAITRDAGDFLADGFAPGQTIVVSGADIGGNDGEFVLLGATPTALVLPTGSITADTGNLSVAIVTKDEMIFPTGVLDASHSSGEDVQLYQPRYASTDLLDGNIYDLIDVFPGPYVYDPRADAPNGAKAFSTSVSLLSGPTKVAMRQAKGATAIEVENATAFPLVGLFPYDVFVGRSTGNQEILAVQDINLQQRALTDLTAPTVVGTTVVLAITAVGAGSNNKFSNASGYRVILERGVAGQEEVVYVIGTTSTTITLEKPTTILHPATSAVELLADVLTVEQVTDAHLGIVDSYSKRSTSTESDDPPITETGTAVVPQISSGDVNRAELVEVPYSSINLASTTDFPVTGNVILNFGANQIKVSLPFGATESVGSTALAFLDTSLLPTVYPFEMILSKGTVFEETVLVTLNALNTLTIASPTRFVHSPAENAVYIPGKQETVELPYTSISGNTLVFATQFVVKSTHYPSEIVIPSKSKSVPKDNGFDFPFRMPADFTTKLTFLLDLLRAAGVDVCLIDKR